MSGLRVAVLMAATAVMIGFPARAGSIVYTPTNPVFGGSPLNGSTLLALGQAQNLPQLAETRRAAALSSASSSASLSPGQVFAQQLTSQVYGSLANQITQAIFGTNAQKNGTFSFQGTTISFVRNGGNIDLTINDGQTITQVTVPAGL